jgi:hypothetical protein
VAFIIGIVSTYYDFYSYLKILGYMMAAMWFDKLKEQILKLLSNYLSKYPLIKWSIESRYYI